MNSINKTLLWIAFLFVVNQCFAVNDSIPLDEQRFHGRFGVGIFISPVNSFYVPSKYARDHIKGFQGNLSSENPLGIKAGATINYKIDNRFNVGISGGVYRWNPRILYTYTSIGFDYQSTLYIDNIDFMLGAGGQYLILPKQQTYINTSLLLQTNLHTKSYLEMLYMDSYLEKHDYGHSHLWSSPLSLEIGLGREFLVKSRKKTSLQLNYSQNLFDYINLPAHGSNFFSVNTKAISLNSTYYLK